MKRVFVLGLVLLVGCADVRREGELIQAEHERKLKEISETDFERIENGYRLQIAELRTENANLKQFIRDRERLDAMKAAAGQNQ